MPRPLALLATVVVACSSIPSAASPTSTSAATAPPSSALSASASPTPAATPGVLDDRFGFVVSDRSGSANVRSETSDAVITAFTPQGRSWTSLSRSVSPDGRSVAYWAPVNNGPVMHVRSTTGGADRTVFAGPSDMFGNTFAWSSDGAGLVFALDNSCQEFCPPVAELWTIDLASGATEKIASGKFWLPVTWDRTAKLVAAGVTGPGGYLVGYDVVDLHQQPYRVRGTEFRPTVLGRLMSSSDARYVLVSIDRGTSSALGWWPLAEPEKRADVAFDGAAAEWRPGTSEIWWVGGLTPPGCRTPPCGGTELNAVDVASGAHRSLHGSFGGVLLGFRVDGSAAMTWLRSPDSLVVVDLKSEQTANLPSGGPFVRVR